MNNSSSKPLKVRVIQSGEDSRWDTFVRNHPDSLPYHLAAWKNAVRDAYGHQPAYFIAEDGKGDLQGALPMIEIAQPFSAAQSVSLPFCDAAGPLVLDVDAEEQLKAAVRERSGRSNVKTIEMRLSGGSNREEGFGAGCAQSSREPEAKETETGLLQQHVKVRLLLDMPDDAEILWKSYKAKLRSQVNKAKKNGLEFHSGNSAELVDEFYHVYAKNMHRLGSPAHSRKFFQCIARNYGSDAKVGVVSFQGEPIGAGILLFIAERVSIPWASTLSDFNKLAPNMLLYWQLIEQSIQHGARQFDFGRSTPGEGTYKFKLQWGAQPEQLYWIKSSIDKIDGQPAWRDEAEPVPNAKKSRRRALVETIWQRMPLPLCNFIGPKIRKYISL